jgi:hypothetical protein
LWLGQVGPERAEEPEGEEGQQDCRDDHVRPAPLHGREDQLDDAEDDRDGQDRARHPLHHTVDHGVGHGRIQVPLAIGRRHRGLHRAQHPLGVQEDDEASHHRLDRHQRGGHRPDPRRPEGLRLVARGG